MCALWDMKFTHSTGNRHTTTIQVARVMYTMREVHSLLRTADKHNKHTHIHTRYRVHSSPHEWLRRKAPSTYLCVVCCWFVIPLRINNTNGAHRPQTHNGGRRMVALSFRIIKTCVRVSRCTRVSICLVVPVQRRIMCVYGKLFEAHIVPAINGIWREMMWLHFSARMNGSQLVSRRPSG